MAFFVIPSSLTPVFAALLFAGNLEILDLRSNIARIIFLVLLCFLFVPVFGVLGAVGALVFSQLAFLFFLLFYVRARVFTVRLFHAFRLPLVAALVACLFVLIIPTFSDVRQGFLAVAVYMIVMLVIQPELRSDLINWTNKLALALRR